MILNGFPNASRIGSSTVSIISGRNPPLNCTLTLITMQGHQHANKEQHESRYTAYFDSIVRLRNVATLTNSIDKVHYCCFDEGNVQVIDSKVFATLVYIIVYIIVCIIVEKYIFVKGGEVIIIVQ